MPAQPAHPTQPTGQTITTTIEQVSYTFTGPLPHPDVMLRYEQALPGCADRIVAMAERQATHRQNLETIVVGGNVWRETAGQVIGALIALSAIGGGVFLLYNGRTVEGYATMLGHIIGFVTVYLAGKKKQEGELEAKRETPAGATGKQ